MRRGSSQSTTRYLMPRSSSSTTIIPSAGSSATIASCNSWRKPLTVSKSVIRDLHHVNHALFPPDLPTLAHVRLPQLLQQLARAAQCVTGVRVGVVRHHSVW